MSIYEKMAKAVRDKDANSFIECLHDDYQFVRHQSSTTLDKSQMSEMIQNMMASDKMGVSNSRCLYENDDILVSHAIMEFPDGSKEAVLSFETKKDGKILCTETGATPLST